MNPRAYSLLATVAALASARTPGVVAVPLHQFEAPAALQPSPEDAARLAAAEAKRARRALRNLRRDPS